HDGDDIFVGAPAERSGVAVRHVHADELYKLADCFLLEAFPEGIAHQRRSAFRREHMTARTTLAEGRHAAGSLRFRVRAVPNAPACWRLRDREAGYGDREEGTS